MVLTFQSMLERLNKTKAIYGKIDAVEKKIPV